MPKAIIIYGPPGSGKGTQANLLANELGYIHFDTGRYIEQVAHDPANKKNKIIQREKKNFDTGILCTPSWVLKIVREKVIKLYSCGLGIVFSGSPRTVFETFGNDKNEGLMHVLEKRYGKKNIIPVLLKVSLKSSLFRNSNRVVCSGCKIMILANHGVKDRCPFCDALLVKRTLDKPEIIKVRFNEYKNRTKPILDGLKKMGYKIYQVNGEVSPYKVIKSIIKIIKKIK